MADDDRADCLLAKEALPTLQAFAQLTFVHNGEEEIERITTTKNKLPVIVFPGFITPRKNGSSTLKELKRTAKLQEFPIIVLTTSPEENSRKKGFRDFAYYHIYKPVDFSISEKRVSDALNPILKDNLHLVQDYHFLITGTNNVIPKISLNISKDQNT